MKIEIAEPGRMTQSGSSLLKLIQNNDMPILDLFIRESVQNSLDAKNDTDKYVTVKFRTGSFNKSRLNNELEGITEALNKKYNEEEYEYISITDTNTVGLTGKLHYDDVSDNNYGNLLKLIYEISKPQDAEGAGGSWGLGKTVYFRVGIGLVLYYSRIRKENGEYESRMAGCLVEDENNSNSLIPKYEGKSKRGIAWWGEIKGENKTRPVIDRDYINSMLNIFNIEPYKNDETGTTIIIPYINHDELLSNNQVVYTTTDGKSKKQFWQHNIEEYLKISLQRWYSPRLNNIYYPYGKFLRASINSNGITKDSMEPVYQIIQALYNRAVTNGKVQYDDILNEVDVKCEKIVLRNVLKYSEAGTVSFIKVNRKLLKMEHPNNKPSPYEYFNCINVHEEKNKPIVTFTRKPGMLVSYENVGAWTDGIQASDSDNYVFGVFVLNSKNELTNNSEKYSLEEYVRKGEMADHTSWNDFSFNNNNPRIISKIQGHVRDKISKEFTEYDESQIQKKSSGLGKVFGDLLLPPQNFGKKPSVSLKNRKQSRHVEKNGDVVFAIEKNNIKYMKDGIEVRASVTAKNKIRNMILSIGVDAEGGTITFEQWEEKMRMKFPFNIEYIKIKLITFDDEIGLDSVIILDRNNLMQSYNKLVINQLKSNNDCYAFRINSRELHRYSVECSIKINMKRRDFNPAFIIEADRGNK
ncbi:hypothetical protein FDB30_01290 [Clostridium botulinum]|uniref:Uncharacterized protein n=1 Tax=Clostridium botulinum TaxID=1491 RepID=A0A846JU10_CLOBO|nr:hypothetical protein [Clostridium botulinum]NFG28702.1 hypothetical protein [Clostridium botulinum]NFG37188.1 hypothetical protein [Clostridium botulinum]NFN04528.1 hypothetical protein [Clostridium botulinum]NFN36770.1 hypothetical protein [Clostridium botulinum]NFN99518.1 hypothetical protein [Clostridium botulinum]